jgi:hypothetical protein
VWARRLVLVYAPPVLTTRPAPALHLHCTSAHARHSLSLPLPGVLSLLCSSRPSLATVFPSSARRLALLTVYNSPCCPRRRRPEPRAQRIITSTRTHPRRGLSPPNAPSRLSIVACASVPSRVRRASRRRDHGPVWLAAGRRRGLALEPPAAEAAAMRRKAAPDQGAARRARAAFPGAAQAEHAGQEGLRVQARRAAGQDQCQWPPVVPMACRTMLIPR